MQSVVPLLGRVLLAAIFLWSGAGKVLAFDPTVGYIASKHLPQPQVIAVLAIIAEIAGGIALVVGFRTRLAAAGLLIYTALAAVLFHDFWAVPPAQHLPQMVNFMKNVAICGGFLYVIAYGAGAWSIDRR